MTAAQNGELAFVLDDDINVCIFTGVVSSRPQLLRGEELIYADFVVACRDSRRCGNQDVKHTNLIEVRVYDELAEYCCQQLHKGMPVVVDAKLDYYEVPAGKRGKRSGLRMAAYQVRPYSRNQAAAAAARSQLGETPSATTQPADA